MGENVTVGDRPMVIHDRCSRVMLIFALPLALVRRLLEKLRISYWRHVQGWKIGEGAYVHWTVKLPRRLNVTLGENASIGQGTRVVAELSGGTLSMAANAKVAQFSLLDCTGALVLDEGVTVSEGSILYTHSHGRNPRNPPRGFSLRIGKGVWICAHAMILASTRTIGENAIVGPYSVIREPVEANTITSTNNSLSVVKR